MATTTPADNTATVRGPGTVPPKLGANAREHTPAGADFMADELYLNSQLDSVLANLGFHDFAPKTQTSPATATAKDARAVQLGKDALNDDTYGRHVTPTVDVLPAPPNLVRDAEYVNVDLVEIQDARPAEDIEHEISVARSSWFSNDELKQLSNLTRGAAQSARREGNLHSSVMHVLGVEELYATTVPALGPCVRVAQAILCAQTGASPSHAPDLADYDVRVVRLDQFDNALQMWPGYTPFFAPADMSTEALSALVSLFMPGGAGAYTWRFRAAANGLIGDGRDHLMPSASRWLAPGGSRHILVVMQNARAPLTVGGGALSLRALWSLEAWIKSHWDPALMDQAWKTAIAATAVYVAPINLQGEFGAGVAAKCVTTRKNNRELNRPWDFVQVPPALDPLVRHRFVPPWDRTPELVADALWVLAVNLGLINDGVRQQVLIGWENQTVLFVGRDGNQVINTRVALGVILTGVADVANGVPATLREELLAIAETVGSPLSQLESARGATVDEGGPFVVGMRNVYGHKDFVTISLPGLNLRRVAGLFIGAHVLSRRTTHRSYVTADSLRSRMRRYAAHLHLVHYFNLAERDIWPDDLAFGMLHHATRMKDLPIHMANFAVMTSMSREHVGAPNWQVLESPYVLRSGRNKTAYFGFRVEGSWYVDDGGRASVSGQSTSYPALDAAIRDTWNNGGTVDVAERTRHNFSPVRNVNGLFGPLGISPRAESGGRRPADITIASDRGFVAVGSNKGGTMVVVR